MKTLAKFMVILGFVFQMNSQNNRSFSNDFFKKSESKTNISFDKELSLYRSCKLLFAPQFDGLFYDSFRKVQGIQNLDSFYNDYDFGMTLGITYQIIKNLKFTSVYNLGMLKFNIEESTGIKSPIIKTSLCFNF